LWLELVAAKMVGDCGKDMKPKYRVLAISGSLRSVSSNAKVLRVASALAREDISILIYSGLSTIPPFNPDLDVEPAPTAVADLRMRLRECDAVLISSPEYAHGIPGVLKNALDWIVSSGELYGKPVALFNTSSRSTVAQAALAETLTVMGARLISKVCISMPTGTGEVDEHSLLHSVAASAVRDVLIELVNASCLSTEDWFNSTLKRSTENH